MLCTQWLTSNAFTIRLEISQQAKMLPLLPEASVQPKPETWEQGGKFQRSATRLHPFAPREDHSKNGRPTLLSSFWLYKNSLVFFSSFYFKEMSGERHKQSKTHTYYRREYLQLDWSVHAVYQHRAAGRRTVSASKQKRLRRFPETEY